MARLSTREIVLQAARQSLVVPAFNIPHLPMMEPVVEALRDTRCFGLIQVARLEWMKFKSGSLKAIRDTYAACKDERFTRLHLDHVPVIDEDNLSVDVEAILAEAIALGYESLMIDGSRLSLEANITETAKAVRMAHVAGLPIEAELGAVLGHEAGPLPPYEELFLSGRGFTDPAEARRFVAETGVDWLSVAVGNIHGAISGAAKSEKKVQARVAIEQLDRIRAACPGLPLVLHGGSGIRPESIQAGIRHGIAKINVGTTLRQAYEAGVAVSAAEAYRRTAEAARAVIRDELQMMGSADRLGTALNA
ncbi:MAG: class II fructose-bisphosphate aldolase [Kiritimatiellia bacterium]